MTVSNTIVQDLDALYGLINANKTTLGIKTAQRKFKGFVNDSDLPFVVIRVGAALWEMQTLTWRRYKRIYRHEVFVKPVSEGLSGYQEGYEAVLPIMQAFGDFYLANLTLNNSIMQILPPYTDSGVVELTWGSMKAWGFYFELPVVEKYT